MEGETIERVLLKVPDIGDGDRDQVLDPLSGVNGVRDVEVLPEAESVQVTFDPREVSIPMLQEALAAAGYTVDSGSAAPAAELP